MLLRLKVMHSNPNRNKNGYLSGNSLGFSENSPQNRFCYGLDHRSCGEEVGVRTGWWALGVTVS